MATKTRCLAVDRQCTVLAGESGIARRYTVYGALASSDCLITGFTGENRDPVTGCYHLGQGYRTYNPHLMRFQSPDDLSPFGLGGINAYVYRDPVNARDPSGHSPITVSAFTQRIMTASFGSVSVVKSLVGKVPSTGLEILISRLTFGGGALSIAGATAQAAGWSSGTFVSNVGVALAGTGHVFQFAKALYDGRNQIYKNVTGNLRSLIGMKAKDTKPSDVELKPTAPPPPSRRQSVSDSNQPEAAGFRASVLSGPSQRPDSEKLSPGNGDGTYVSRKFSQPPNSDMSNMGPMQMVRKSI
ncbi:RHS repeat-associated core domain-containing protein [Pseudomonas promysalinigenes]|uniref:RHS repeat-associated core domain-containing protein n=1 Tax=Pseudomonas promysalinigenes TaxID=485898 RepID=A0ABY6AS31_9PSED|nr:RHS repeat-associated core domain-containing protein [Pseudomonas promysalinigenes]UXH40315.1 RHS repeat-associated core domain-containing protein [Pseudomonas promysalinigenes]